MAAKEISTKTKRIMTRARVVCKSKRLFYKSISRVRMEKISKAR